MPLRVGPGRVELGRVGLADQAGWSRESYVLSFRVSLRETLQCRTGLSTNGLKGARQGRVGRARQGWVGWSNVACCVTSEQEKTGVG